MPLHADPSILQHYKIALPDFPKVPTTTYSPSGEEKEEKKLINIEGTLFNKSQANQVDDEMDYSVVMAM